MQTLLQVFESAEKVARKTLGLGFPFISLDLGVFGTIFESGDLHAKLLYFSLCYRVDVDLNLIGNL